MLSINTKKLQLNHPIQYTPFSITPPNQTENEADCLIRPSDKTAISVGENEKINLWNLDKNDPVKKSTQIDLTALFLPLTPKITQIQSNTGPGSIQIVVSSYGSPKILSFFKRATSTSTDFYHKSTLSIPSIVTTFATQQGIIPQDRILVAGVDGFIYTASTKIRVDNLIHENLTIGTKFRLTTEPVVISKIFQDSGLLLKGFTLNIQQLPGTTIKQTVLRNFSVDRILLGSRDPTVTQTQTILTSNIHYENFLIKNDRVCLYNGMISNTYTRLSNPTYVWNVRTVQCLIRTSTIFQ